MGKGQRWAAAVCREAGAEPLVLVGGGLPRPSSDGRLPHPWSPPPSN